MSSLNSIMSSAASGLVASQTALKVVSDNVANVNTPGYVQKSVAMTALGIGDGAGVSVGVISRVIDRFLQQASLSASADSGQAAAQSDLLDRAQALFGDPTSDNAYFNQLDNVFQAFSSAASNAASGVQRNQALATITGFLSQSSSIANNLTSLGSEAAGRAAADVGQINSLLTQIDQLNTSISHGMASGQDMSDAQNSQSGLIDQLSKLMSVTVTAGPNGRVDVRGGVAGAALVTAAGAAQLAYVTTPGAPSQITLTQAGGSPQALTQAGGELQGLMDLTNTKIPAMSSELGEYVSQAVDQINAAHNAASAVPPPTSLTGRDTGLDLPTAVSGFAGKTTVAVTDSSGVVQKRIDIDFTAGTMSVNGAAGLPFAPANFLTSLNTALGASGSASFSNGALSLSATGSNGVAIADDPTTPSSKAGQGFSQFFGMNDLITSTGFPAATGLKASDPNGFTAGGQITMRLSDANGGPLKDVTVAVPAGGAMQDLLDAMNSTSSGVGLYGQFALDADGRMSFTPSLPGVSLSVTGDTTQRGAGGPAVSQLFGLATGAQANLASSYSVRADIAGDGSKLAFAEFDTTAAVGSTALAVGDGRGALALAAVANSTVAFQKAGDTAAISSTLTQYAAQLSGSIAQAASNADTNQTNAATISSEADTRRASVEGVNLDEELIKLTTYQQSYSASARLVSAVKDMYDVLLNM